MVIDLIQTLSGFKAEYLFLCNSAVVYTASIPRNAGKLDAHLMQNNLPVLSLKYNNFQQINNFGKKPSEKQFNIFSIEESGNAIGKICLKRTKAFWGYAYFEMVINDKKYYCYEVGLGKKGLFVCIYYNDEQIALIEKEAVVKDNKDCYKLYTISSEHLSSICLFALYYDHLRFGNYGEIVYKSKEVYYLYTMNKELKSKYDPEFKSLC